MTLSLEDAARLGGSDVAGVLGLSPWQTPLSIYARVVAALDGRRLPEQQGSQLRRGRHLERAVLRLYEEETGARVKEENVRLTHPRMAFTRATLDAVAERERLNEVVEVKTAGLSEVRHWGEPGTDSVPQIYLFQSTWYLGVARERGQVDDVPLALAALVGGDLRTYSIPFDADLFLMLEAALERFWVDHVLPRRPPPVTEPLRDADAAGALYPRHSGAERHWDTLQTEEQKAVREYLKARARLKRAQLRAAGAEAALKLAMKDTPRVYGLPDSAGARSISWKKNKDGQDVDWRGVADELSAYVGPNGYKALVDAYTTAREGARPLRVTETREEE